MPRSRQPLRTARRRRTMTARWRKLLGAIPGYDPISTAGDCWFDAEAAQLALDFFPECLVHAKGKTAGQPFTLEAWEAAIVANVFGWKRPDGTRRYRQVFIYVPKKNGKTAFGTGLLLYVLACDDEMGAELYSAACSRDQASYPFDHAKGMMARCPQLRERLKIFGGSGGAQRKSIVFEDLNSFYRPLAADADTADGVNPHFALIDEVHRHKNRELADVLVKSQIARSQPLAVYTSTADYDRPSLCNELLGYARKVRDGTLQDETFLPVIYEAKSTDDWTDPNVWRRVNPNLGVTVSEDRLAHMVAEARVRPMLENSFKRLHLNIVTEQIERWVQMEQWDRCGGEDSAAVDDIAGAQEWRARALMAMRDGQAWAGLDLGSVGDLSALVLLFPRPDNRILVLPWFWMPEDGIDRKDPQNAEQYRVWIRQGFIETTSGNVTDYDVLRNRVKELSALYRINTLAIDRLFQGQQLCTQLMGDGLDVVAFGQGMLSMAAPSKVFEERIAAGTFEHGHNPVLRWMASNVQAKGDEHGNKKPVKPSKDSPAKVDGIVALIMALGEFQIKGEQLQSVYETRGMLVLGEVEEDAE